MSLPGCENGIAQVGFIGALGSSVRQVHQAVENTMEVRRVNGRGFLRVTAAAPQRAEERFTLLREAGRLRLRGGPLRIGGRRHDDDASRHARMGGAAEFRAFEHDTCRSCRR